MPRYPDAIHPTIASDGVKKLWSVQPYTRAHVLLRFCCHRGGKQRLFIADPQSRSPDKRSASGFRGVQSRPPCFCISSPA